MKVKIYLLILLGIFLINSAQATPKPAQDPRVKAVYDHFQGQTVWIKNGQWTGCAQAVLETLSHVDHEGLWQENYDPLIKAAKEANLSSPEGQKKADALLTLAALNYISDMRGERLDPHAVVKSIHLKQVNIDEADALKGYLTASDQCAWIHGLSPTTPEYQNLKKLLASYRQKQAQGGWPVLPKNTKLEKGNRGPLIKTLRIQLAAQDVLSAQEQEIDVFDEALEDSIKSYQRLHGLEPDGKVGAGTLTTLNTPVNDRIRAIIVSLERHRWLPTQLPARYIQVNISGFYLKAVHDNKVMFFMPIITGKQHTKTPVFNAPMKEIIFNPSWHVPSSIARELMPKINANPDTYAAKGYYFTEGRIVQSPGHANALGKIRFTIESPYDIYLHGTPQEKLFLTAKRAYSHGCIRVESPEKLASFVLNDVEKWSADRIKQESSGTRTKRVKLEHSLPVFITYFTVFEDENHQMHFVADEYGQDKLVWNALEKLR